MKIIQEKFLNEKKNTIHKRVGPDADLIKLLFKLYKNVNTMDKLINEAERAYTGADNSLDFLIDSEGDAISQVGMSIEDFFDDLNINY